jgi:hypothetical protein
MAKTYTVITDEIEALDCPITKVKIQTLYQDILDFANAGTNNELKGGFDIADIGFPASPVNPFGIVQSVAQVSFGGFVAIEVTLNQSILYDYQPFLSIEHISGGANANVYTPLIAGKIANRFLVFFNEGSSADQALRIYFKIEKI